MRENHEVCIVGRNRITGELLSAAIERELGFISVAVPELPPLHGIFEVWEVSPTIVLVDAADPLASAQLRKVLAEARGDPSVVSLAAFNVGWTSPELYEAIRCGLQGIFLSAEPLEDCLIGIRTIAEGDVWLPRQILVGAVTDSGPPDGFAVTRAGLTLREVEILGHLARGCTNEQIGAALFISAHTVKTHVYNIFRKLGVNNRLRATLWAAENLGVMARPFSTGEPSARIAV
jgi:LuxR family transcriptional regulator, positive regulator of biofilm formation